jgi:multiple sugar transport system substrate-binding protein
MALAVVASFMAFSGGTVAAKAVHNGTVTVKLDGWASTPSEPNALKIVLGHFHKAYPKINVDYTVVNGDFETQMKAAYAAGTGPDVMYADEGWAQDFMRAGEFQSLNSYIAHDPSYHAADLYKGLLAGFTVGKNLYGIPKDYSTLAMWYNPAVFHEAGIKSVPQTDAQFQKTACTIRKWAVHHGHPNLYGAGLPADQARWQPILQGDGGAVLNKSQSKATINNKAGATAIGFWGSLLHSGCAAEPGTVGTGWSGEEFGKGYAGMVFEGPWLLSPMQTSWPTTPYKLAQLPAGPKGRGNLAFSVAYAMNKASKVKSAAWTLISYLTGRTGEAQWVRLFGVLPARSTIKPPKGDGVFVKGAAVAEPWSFKPGYFNAGGPNTVLNNDLDKVGKGQMTAKAAAADIAKAIALWEKNG